jgi:hypothetical protein
MKTPNKIVPSLVWLARQDEALSVLPHALYLSSERSLKLWGSGANFEDWKARLTGHLLTVCDNKGASQIVEGGSEVLQNIPCHESQINRHDNVMGHAIDNAIGLRIALWNDTARVRVDERAKGFVEVMEVLVGPIDF